MKIIPKILCLAETFAIPMCGTLMGVNIKSDDRLLRIINYGYVLSNYFFFLADLLKYYAA
jgi:hypothetical protein